MSRQTTIPIIERADHEPRRSLRASLLGWLLGVALIPLLVAGTIGYTSARRSQHQVIEQTLETSAETGKKAVHAYFDRAARELDHQSRLQANVRFLGDLNRSLEASRLPARAWVGSPAWEAATAEIGHELIRFRNSSPWYDILILNEAGVVLFSCLGEDDLGSNILTGSYTRSNLASAVRRAVATGGMVLSQFGSYEPSQGLESTFLVVPMSRAGRDVHGLMAFQLDGQTLGRIIEQSQPRDAAAALYLVDENLRLLNRPGGDDSLQPLRDRVLTREATTWLERQKSAYEGTLAGSGDDPPRRAGSLTSYPGVFDRQVFGRSVTIEVQGARFGLMAELPAAEALEGLRRIKLAMFLILTATALLTAGAGQVISQRIVQPIMELGHLMNRVADGHAVPRLDVAGPTELRALAESFGAMIQRLDEAQTTRDRQFQLQRGQAELNERMRGEPDSETLAAAILEHIGDYYGAQAGAFYLARPGQSLVLAAHFGESDDHWPVRRLREGQGVVGRAAMRRRIQVLRDIPSDHLILRTAMGESLPRSLVIAPFHIAGQVKGIMELASFRPVSDEDLEFLRLVAESVAVALDSSRSRERVHRLLEETRRQAGTLSRQQKELQDKNERLARSDRYKSEFLANMSHELRTPLNSMMLMAEVLGENRFGRLDAAEVESAHTISQAGHELLTIIDDILDLSKVEAGKLELHPEPLVVETLMSELQHLFQPEADGKGVEFRSYVGPGVPEVVVTDGLRLKQILKNLLSNAFKFTEQGSVVLRARVPTVAEMTGMGCRDAGSCLAFSVADTGIGMSEEVQANVFEAFNQGDGTIGRRFGGSGLGLSISRRLAELLAGRLEVSSVEGKGSRFTLYLPARVEAHPAEDVVGPDDEGWVAPEPETGMVVPDASDLAAWRLVLCDDEMRTVYRLGDDLRAAGRPPEIVRHPEALDEILDRQVGPILLLVNPWCAAAEGRPEGDDLLRALRARRADGELRLVALQPGDKPAAGAADAVVPKPVEIGAVLAACRAAVAAEVTS